MLTSTASSGVNPLGATLSNANDVINANIHLSSSVFISDANTTDNDILTADIGAVSNTTTPYIENIETLNLRTLGARSLVASSITGAKTVNVTGGDLFTFGNAQAGINYSVAGNSTGLTLTQAGSDSSSNSINLGLKGGKLGVLTLGDTAGVDFETFNITVSASSSAKFTEAGTPAFVGDNIIVSGTGDTVLTFSRESLGANATPGSQTSASIDGANLNGKFTVSLEDSTTLDNFSVANFVGVDAVSIGTEVTDADVITGISSGMEIIVNDIEAVNNTLALTPKGSGVSDSVTVTLNHVTAGSSITLTSLTLDGFENAVINSIGTNSSTTTVKNSIATVDGTANDKNLTITGDKFFTVATAVKNNYTNIISTNTSGVDLVLEAGTDVKFQGGTGNDRLVIDTVADVTSADNFDGGSGTNTFAISATIGNDFTTAQRAVINNFQSLEYTGAQDFATGGTAASIDLTKLSGINTLKLPDTLTVDSGDTLTVKAANNFTFVAGASAGDAANVIVQITNAQAAGTNDFVNLNLLEAASSYTNTGFAMAGVENLNVNIQGNLDSTETVITLSDVDSTVLQDITVKSSNTGKTSSGSSQASDSLLVTGIQSTLLRTFNASAMTGNLVIDGLASSFIATGATITGGSGKNFITGGTGADIITTGKSNDVVSGGLGADVFNVGAGNDIVLAGTGASSTPEKVSATLLGSGGSGVWDAGDVYTVTILGKAFTLTAVASSSTTDSLDKIAKLFVININADSVIGKLVNASSESTDALAVTSLVDGNFVNFTIAATNGSSAFTITNTNVNGANSTDADIVNASLGADFIHGAGGANVYNLGLSDLAADTVVILGANESDNIINHFEAGTSGTDLIRFSIGNAVANGTNTTTLTNITTTGATSDNIIFYQVTNAATVGGVDTAAEVTTYLSGVTLTGIASGEKVVFALNDTVNTYLWQFTKDGTAGIQAANLSLMATLNGVTALANGDLAVL